MFGQWGPRPNGLAASFIDYITKGLPDHPSVAKDILQSYGIKPELSDDAAAIPILEFASDVAWVAPNVSFARGFPGPAYRYCFSDPNPWDGQWKGIASHIMDIKALFLNYNEFSPSSQAENATTFAKDTIAFINGKAPWKAYDEQDATVKVFGPSSEKGLAVEVSEKEDNANYPRNKVFKYETTPGWESLAGIWGKFLRGL